MTELTLNLTRDRVLEPGGTAAISARHCATSTC